MSLSSQQRQKLLDAISRRLGQIRKLFKRPAEVRITIVVRAPFLPDGDVVVTDEENLTDAIKSLDRLKKKDWA